MRTSSLASLCLLVTLGVGASKVDAQPESGNDRETWPTAPRLTVVVSVDQLRGDSLYRFRDLLLPARDGDRLGGFAYLMRSGAYFADARYDHYPLFTGPGHSIILTGADPYKSGIVGNDWWDTAKRQQVYCVDDPRFDVVGAAEGSRARPMGPGKLLSTTVGDELELATAGRSKTVSMAIKDRAAILLGGHAADVSIWYDTTGGRWISSTAFCRDGELPEWVEQVNGEGIPAKSLGTDWTTTVSEATLRARTIRPTHIGADIPEGFGHEFPHHVGAEPSRSNFHAFILTPAANDYVFQTAVRAVEAEGIGQDDVPDLLSISLSANDYAGHAFGPYSPEVLEMTLATDRALSDFINYLDGTIPGGMDSVLFVLTADHGVTPIPEDVAGQPLDLGATRLRIADVVRTIGDALTARFGAPRGGCWFATTPDDPTGSELDRSGAFIDGAVFLSPEAIRGVIEAGVAASRRDVERVARDGVNGAALPGVYACYGKTQILEGDLADNDLARHLANAVHPRLSPDLIIIPDLGCLQDPPSAGHATSHGTPYAYDTHVPVIVCYPLMVRPGVYFDPIVPTDIAPTISLLLGVEFPSGCDGRALSEALRARPRLGR